MARRAPKKDGTTTMRSEKDLPQICPECITTKLPVHTMVL